MLEGVEEVVEEDKAVGHAGRERCRMAALRMVRLARMEELAGGGVGDKVGRGGSSLCEKSSAHCCGLSSLQVPAGLRIPRSSTVRWEKADRDLLLASDGWALHSPKLRPL